MRSNRAYRLVGGLALVRRLSNRCRGRVFRNRRRRPRRLPSVASILWDKWREESDRRNLETSGITFSVKVIGVDAVAGAYDDIGCQRVLKKCRKRGYGESLPVLLSITSTNVQIIQFEWARVVTFEHAVTAISTCYTDHCRPRLFTYIVKDYTTGNHFCLAFKTMKRSGTNGKRLQTVFGYAFDSCVSSTLSSEQNSELENCLQISSPTRRRNVFRSNSNFSSVLETDWATHMPSNAAISGMLNHHDSRNTLSRTEGYSRDQCSVDDSHVQRESFKLSRPSIAGTKCCCYCHCKVRKRIKRSLSDGFLHSSVLQTVHLQPLTGGQFIQDNMISNCKLNSIHKKTSVNGYNAGPQQEGSEEINREDIVGSAMCSAESVHSNIDWLKSDGLSYSVDSIASNVSDNIIILLSSSLDHIDDDGIGEQCTERISESTSQQMIKRQVGYLNLPTNGVDVYTQRELPCTSTGFDTHSRSRPTATYTDESDEFAVQVSHVSSRECKKITSCSAFNSEAFVSELTFKLRQLAQSISDRPSNEELCHFDTVKPHITLPNSPSTELNNGTPVSIQSKGSHYCNETCIDSTTPSHNVTLQTSPCGDSSSCVNHQSSPIATTSSAATGLNAHLQQVLPSNHTESGICPPQQNLAKSTAITSNLTTSTTNIQSTSNSPPNPDETKTDSSNSSTDTAGTSSSMVNRDSFVCGMCSQCMSTQEAREKLSQMLNIMCLPSSQEITCGDEGADNSSNKRTLTCVIATLEQTIA